MTISICIATYNGERFIPHVFKSILDQISNEDELLVVDDASLDGTVDCILSFKDARIKLVRNSQNIGAPESFFKAIQLATKDVILLADQDDEWLPRKAEHIRQYFQHHPVELFVHNAYIFKDKKILSQTLFEQKDSAKGVVKNFISNCFIGCCMAFRRRLIFAIIPSWKLPFVYHDQFIGLVASLVTAAIHFDSTCLIYFNRHTSNVSQLKRRKNILLIIRERFFLFIMLLFQLPTVFLFLWRNKRNLE